MPLLTTLDIKKQHEKQHAIFKGEGDMPFLLDGFCGQNCSKLYLLSKRLGDVPLCLTSSLERDSVYCYLSLEGVVNGIVLLVWDGHRFPYSHSMCLWNPATKEFKHVPPPRNPYDDVHALGFDAKSNDFRIISFNRYIARHEIYGYEMYSLNTNSWKNIQAPWTKPQEWVLVKRGCDGYVDGFHYWH